MQENYIPKLADIDSACIAIDFDINLEGKDVEKILETQKILMAQKKDYFKKRYDDSGYITISYTLKMEKRSTVYIIQRMILIHISSVRRLWRRKINHRILLMP